MNRVTQYDAYFVDDTDKNIKYQVNRSKKKEINNIFTEVLFTNISQDIGFYTDDDYNLHYVRWDEESGKYYAKRLDIFLDNYDTIFRDMSSGLSYIKNKIANNINNEYEAIPKRNLTQTSPDSEPANEFVSTVIEEPKPVKDEEKNKYSDAEIEKYNKFIQEFNMMMSEEYSKSFRTKKYNELIKKLSEDKRLLEMLQDESFSGDEGKNILNTMNKIYNKWKDR